MQENYIVGIYARLSRDDERAGESVSIENQKEMRSTKRTLTVLSL